MTQPLDVAVFRTLKGHWRSILRKFKKTPHGWQYAALPKEEFPQLLKKLINTLNPTIAANLKSVFRKCGICPLNPQAMLSRIPAAQASSEANSSQTSIEPEVGTDDTNTPAELLDKTLVNMLSEMRYSNKHCADSANSSSLAGPSARISKRKRLAVSQRKSMSSRNLEGDDTESVHSDSANKEILGLLPSTSESGPSTSRTGPSASAADLERSLSCSPSPPLERTHHLCPSDQFPENASHCCGRRPGSKRSPVVFLVSHLVPRSSVFNSHSQKPSFPSRNGLCYCGLHQPL